MTRVYCTVELADPAPTSVTREAATPSKSYTFDADLILRSVDDVDFGPTRASWYTRCTGSIIIIFWYHARLLMLACRSLIEQG